MRIDHRTRSVRFGTDLSEAQRTDLPEGPHIQSMPSEQIRTQLMRIMVTLDGAINTIYPDRYNIIYIKNIIKLSSLIHYLRTHVFFSSYTIYSAILFNIS